VPKPLPYDPVARDARQRAYQSVRTLAEDYPGVDEVSIDLWFKYPTGAQYAPPHSRIFAADMQAFFEFRCPEAGCQGGGYQLADAVRAALRGKRGANAGTVQCRGSRAGETCLMELHYSVRQAVTA
jgi:hypothetical protein